ncbi:uncharacterized protein C8R40DRAFT_1074713 [Lentinula edodes]|uniref:uncharacterized protein n=1 Tax=Lentinula edodes TaxID=5353 RepID=UPI001E8CFB3D|nr:uncharacterized protein C8R40DRAFT_1074713 [Lentinula edodes]KAH7868565.1 hypothetical protein C8R40DRAFT_1074713 [Lentinula edodes]
MTFRVSIDMVDLFKTRFYSSVNISEGGEVYMRRAVACSESRDESQINPARLPGNIASLRLTKSKKDAEMYSNVLHNKIKAAEETQKQINILKSQLTAQRQVLNAYHVCLARLAAQSTQILETSQTTRDTRARPNSPVPSDTVSTRNAARKPSVPVASNNANVVVTPSASAEVQLRALVARKLGVEGGNEDPEVERVFQGFIKVAKARARNQVRYTGNMGIGEPVSEEILDTLAAEVNRKTQILQHASDLSLELACGTEHALVTISKFQKTTISSFEEILNSQLSSIRSYIDHLRIYVVADSQRDAQQGTQNSESLVPNKSPTRVEPDFGHEVRKILGLSEAETSKKVLAEIGRLVNTIQHKSQYLEAMQIRPRDLSSQRARETETIASYESQKQQIEDTIEKLLIRKIDKADSLGHSLVRDIEALLIGIDDIVGHGNSGRDDCNSKNMTVVRSHSNHT